MSAGCALRNAALLSRDVGAFTDPSASGEVGLKNPLPIQHLTSILVLGQAQIYHTV